MSKHIGASPSTPINGEDHLSIQSLLPEYVTIQILEQEPPPSWDPLELHLALCPVCHREAKTLLLLVGPFYQEEGLPLHHTPPPDISFLDLPPAPTPA